MANYISNKEFTQAIVEYINECNQCEAEGKEIPVIPNNIALQFNVLAKKLGSRFNFVNYSFNDEMVSSALFACCYKIRKFNINVSSNAFAYFTNVCWRAMVDVINAEEKNSYIKAMAFRDVDIEDYLDDGDISDSGEGSNPMKDFIPYFDVEEYQRKMDAQKSKTKSKKTIVPPTALDI